MLGEDDDGKGTPASLEVQRIPTNAGLKGEAEPGSATKAGSATNLMYAPEADSPLRDAKEVQERGTERQKEAVRQDNAAPQPTAEASPRPPARKPTREEVLIAHVKEAVAALSSMPSDAGVVVAIVRDSDSSQYIEERLFKAFDWLKACVDEWIKARHEELAARVRS